MAGRVREQVMENPDLDSAGIRGLAKPPVILAGLVAAGSIASWVLPRTSVSGLIRTLGMTAPSNTNLKIIGGIVGALSAALFVWGQAELRRHGQPIPTDKPADVLVQTFLYRRISRNPIYLGMTGLPVGLGLYSDSIMLAGAGLAFAVYCNSVVIPAEEAYLERRFEDNYRAFKSGSPRWLLL